MSAFIGFLVAIAIFSGWMSVVGNPHVVETVIGLVLAVAGGIIVKVKLKKTFTRLKDFF